MSDSFCYEQKRYILNTPSRTSFLTAPPRVTGYQGCEIPVCSEILHITAVINPVLMLHDLTITFEEQPVVRWEKSSETFSVYGGHALLGDQESLNRWVDGHWGDPSNDYHFICEQNFTDSCGIRTLLSGDEVFSFTCGNWNWHFYLGYDKDHKLVKLSVPIEKDIQWYENHFDPDQEVLDLNHALQNNKESIVATFISMNMEDIQNENTHPTYSFSSMREAFIFAYNIDWETTGLHLQHIRWGEYRFGTAEVEEWCARKKITKPDFLVKREQKYIQELQELRKKEPTQ